jgi:ankyrin repeat protein
VQDRFGGSPLDDAIRANKIDAANLLRQLGANVQSQVQVNETENKLTKTTPV